MDGTEVAVPALPAEKGAAREVPAGFRVSHLDRYYIGEVFRAECIGTNVRTSGGPDPEERENVCPTIVHPGIEILHRRCNPIAENLATEAALEAALIRGSQSNTIR
jgi:hypothetical protein